MGSSRARVPSRLRYGMYSSTAGTGNWNAFSGSQRRAPRRQPSLSVIQTCSSMCTGIRTTYRSCSSSMALLPVHRRSDRRDGLTVESALSLPIWAVDEIAVLHPLGAAGGRNVLQDAHSTVRAVLIHQLHVAFARRDHRHEYHVAVCIRCATQENRPPLIVGPHLQPILAIEAIDADAREPVLDTRAPVHVRQEGQVLLNATHFLVLLDTLDCNQPGRLGVEDLPISPPEIQLMVLRCIAGRRRSGLLQ